MGRHMRNSLIVDKSQLSAASNCRRTTADANNDTVVSVNNRGQVEEEEEEERGNHFKPEEPNQTITDHIGGSSINSSPNLFREPTLPAHVTSYPMEENCERGDDHHQQRHDDELLLFPNLESPPSTQPHSDHSHATQNAVAEWVIDSTGVNNQRFPDARMTSDNDDDVDDYGNAIHNAAIGPEDNYLISVQAEVFEEVEATPLHLDDVATDDYHHQQQQQQQQGVASRKYEATIFGMSRKGIIIVLDFVVAVMVIVVVVVALYVSTKTSPPTDVTMARLEAIRSLLLSHSISSREDLYEKSSPQYQSMLWLATHDGAMLNAITATPWQTIMERYIMAAFYFATGGASWSNGDGGGGGDPINFLSNQSICSWHDATNTSGVICNQTTMALVLDNKGLQGSILSELGKLSELKLLALDHNRLSGTIPTELAGLTNLATLDLSSNTLLGGTLISGLGQLSNLQELALNNNHLSGTLPTELARVTKLTKLDLSYNIDLRGTIVADLAQLSILRYVAISNTQLSGTIPTELARLSKLTSLIISFNPQLGGTVLAEFGGLSGLQNLALDHNELSGTIPTELGLLTMLTSLVISGNKLTGTVPTILAALSNLKYLSLGSNSLRGNLTPFFCNRNTSWYYFEADCTRNVECGCCTTC